MHKFMLMADSDAGSNSNTSDSLQYPDGKLELEIKEDGVYITAFAPSDSNKRISISQVIALVDENGIQDYDFRAMSQIVNSTEPVTTIKISSNTSVSTVDEAMKIEIAEDKMEVRVSFTPPNSGGQSLKISDVYNALSDSRVTFGIDDKSLRSMFSNREYHVKYTAAKGREVVHGEDAKLIFSFNREKKEVHPKVLEDGKVDYRELDLIELVRQDQLLVTLVPVKEGMPGVTVFGTEISCAKGKSSKIPFGKNVRLSDDGLKLFSDLDGQIQYSNNKINVNPVYEVAGNVDSATGNIQFLGNVIVKGNVCAGFSVIATGDIEVKGVVEGATLQAKGDVFVQLGVQGMGKCKIEAGGNVKAKYIENSTVRAKGSIRVDVIMHSQVWCGGELLLNGKKGLLVGGKAQVAKAIDATSIGSAMATTTEVEVGLELEEYDRYIVLTKEITTLKAELTKIDQNIETLMRLKKMNSLTDDKKALLIKLIRTKSLALEKVESCQHEINDLLPKLEKGSGVVKAKNYIYPGVKLTIGDAIMYVKSEIRFCTMYNAESEIKVGTYS